MYSRCQRKEMMSFSPCTPSTMMALSVPVVLFTAAPCTSDCRAECLGISTSTAMKGRMTTGSTQESVPRKIRAVTGTATATMSWPMVWA